MENDTKTSEQQNPTVHGYTHSDIKEAEAIAMECRMDIVSAEFVTDEHRIMRLRRIILADSNFNLSSPNTRAILME